MSWRITDVPGIHLTCVSLRFRQRTPPFSFCTRVKIKNKWMPFSKDFVSCFYSIKFAFKCDLFSLTRYRFVIKLSVGLIDWNIPPGKTEFLWQSNLQNPLFAYIIYCFFIYNIILKSHDTNIFCNLNSLGGAGQFGYLIV